jgi:hypothetical protein
MFAGGVLSRAQYAVASDGCFLMNVETEAPAGRRSRWFSTDGGVAALTRCKHGIDRFNARNRCEVGGS